MERHQKCAQTEQQAKRSLRRNQTSWFQTSSLQTHEIINLYYLSHLYCCECGSWRWSNCQHLFYHWKSKRVPEKNLLLLYWLCQSLWLCESQQTVKVLKEMGTPDHLTCLLSNLYAGQEGTVKTKHGTMNWFKIGKGVRQGCILSSCLFNLYAEYTMWNARLDETQLGPRLEEEISITSDIQMIPPLW